MLKPPMEIDIPFVPKYVEELLLWRDVKRSGILFGACTTIALFFFITKMSLPTFVCYLIGIALVVATAWTRVGPSIGQPMPKLPALISDGMSDTDYKYYCERMKPEIDQLTGYIYKLVTCKDFVLNAKIILALFAFGKIFSFMSPGVLGFIVVLFAFTAPKVYELNKDQIDKGMVTAQGRVNEGWSVTKAEAGKIWDKAPHSIKRVADSLTPKKTE
eukprot:jgi/Ulvmu1/10206/UM060_0006.1